MKSQEYSKLSKMGAKKSNEVQKKKKEESKQNEKLVDILKKVIFSEIKSEVVKKIRQILPFLAIKFPMKTANFKTFGFKQICHKNRTLLA